MSCLTDLICTPIPWFWILHTSTSMGTKNWKTDWNYLSIIYMLQNPQHIFWVKALFSCRSLNGFQLSVDRVALNFQIMKSVIIFKEELSFFIIILSEHLFHLRPHLDKIPLSGRRCSTFLMSLAVAVSTALRNILPVIFSKTWILNIFWLL